MRSYSETKVFNGRAQTLLSQATDIVARLPDPSEGEEPYRCHEIARVVGHILELDVQDGTYGAVNHSWLWTEHYPPTPRTCLLDVYCVGRLPMVQLIDLNCVLPHWNPHWRMKRGWRYLGYQYGDARTDIKHDVVARLIKTVAV